jgi:hypothetical protein
MTHRYTEVDYRQILDARYIETDHHRNDEKSRDARYLDLQFFKSPVKVHKR